MTDLLFSTISVAAPYYRVYAWELAFRFDLIAVRLVLRLKVEVLMCWAKEHFAIA